jgi:NADH-quinone oxidoreductase subunit G
VFARVGEHVRLAATDQGGPAGDPMALSDAPLAYAIADYYQTNPISRASPTMAECSRLFVHPALAAAE